MRGGADPVRTKVAVLIDGRDARVVTRSACTTKTKTTFNKDFGFGSNRLHCRKQDVRRGREERKVVCHGSLRKKKKLSIKLTRMSGKRQISSA